MSRFFDKIKKTFRSKPQIPLPGYKLGWKIEGSILRNAIDQSHEPVFRMFSQMLNQFEQEHAMDISQLIHIEVEFQYKNRGDKNEQN